MPTTNTIPYPLSSTLNGVVVYTNEIEFPQSNLDYTLSLNGTTVSSIFNVMKPNIININSLTNDANYQNNLPNVGQAAVANYSNSGGTATSYNLPITLTGFSINNFALDELTGYIYVICALTYDLTLNISYYDMMSGSSFDGVENAQYTATSFLKFDKIYGTLSFISNFDTSLAITHMTIVNSTLYMLNYDGTQKTIILSMPLTGGTISTLYTTPDGPLQSVGPYSLIRDSIGNLYVSQNGDGTILKVDLAGNASIFATFEYPPATYGYVDPVTHRKFKGRPQGIAFDSSDNLYVSDNGTSMDGGHYFNSRWYYTGSYIYKIPSTNSPGQTYNPDNAITGQNTYPISGQSNPYYRTFNMVADDIGNLYITPENNTNLYKYVIATNTLDPVAIVSNLIISGNTIIIRDAIANLYYISDDSSVINTTRIATEGFTFENVYVSDYQGSNFAALSLDQNSLVIDPNVIVFNTLSSDTSLSTFTVDSEPVNDNDIVNVAYGTTSVSVIAIPTDPGATVGPITGDTGLQTGDNLVSFTITAADGIATQTYNITVHVNSNNSGGSPGSDTFLSTFTVDGTPVNDNDTVNVAYGTTSVTVVAIPTDPGATVGPITGDTGLQTGDNLVSFTVTAADGIATQTYNITVRVNSNNLLGDSLCFKENSKILCLINNSEVYLPIQEIRKGTLVKTSLDGYIPVDTIGYTKIYNSGNSLRSRNRLYECSPDKYPELFESLIITGCHSILVDSLTDKQENDIMEELGRLMITGNKYRLMACYDEKSEPYKIEGLYNIWHLALENENYYRNYGIFANGLLVETCSRRMMKEYSGMVLLE